MEKDIELGKCGSEKDWQFSKGWGVRAGRSVT